MNKASSETVRLATDRDAGRSGSDLTGLLLEEQWNASRASTAPTERAVAEEGVQLAYRAAGLPCPRITWHAGPVSLAMSWLAAPAAAGPNVAEEVIASACRQTVLRLESHPDRRVKFLRDRFALGRSAVTGASMQAAVVDDIRTGQLPLNAWLRRLGASLANKRWPPSFAESGASQHRLCEVAFAAGLEALFEPRSGTALHGLHLVAESAGWMLPHAHVCWLSDRPVGLSFETSGRLHSASGPALQYGDGWSAYRWKGARIPRWLIDEPHRITLAWIDAEAAPSVRRAMIDIFTPLRFVSEGGADCVATDAKGSLWLRKWIYRGVVIDTWAAVEPPSQDGERVFRYVPSHLRTPAEALAWFAALPGHDEKRSPRA